MGSARHPVFGTFNVRARRLVLVAQAAWRLPDAAATIRYCT